MHFEGSDAKLQSCFQSPIRLSRPYKQSVLLAKAAFKSLLHKPLEYTGLYEYTLAPLAPGICLMPLKLVCNKPGTFWVG
jgi:hypothetical protein